MNLILFGFIINFLLNCVASDEKIHKYEYDPNGYVIFCLCMGRFGSYSLFICTLEFNVKINDILDFLGNQADHFLGAMNFAKLINRTFVVPPFRTYKNVPFSEWFRLDKLQEYHRSISAEDFMQHIATKYWPNGKRIGFCWLLQNTPISECKMKEGNPFGPFWNELGVDFDGYEKYDWGYEDAEIWRENFPPEKYPVLALKGAPAAFPVLAEHRHYQKYFQWSDTILNEVNSYITKTFGERKFIGIHLRNGIDWKNACSHVADGLPAFMASPQCLEGTNRLVKQDICFPSDESILEKLKNVVEKTGITNIYVATDQNPMKNQIEKYLKEYNVRVYHHDPYLPVIDLAILGKSDYFIGNCVSSFTSFIKRERDINNKISEFWGF